MRLREDTPLTDGLTAVRQERDRLDAEISAFEEFNDRIATLTPHQTTEVATAGLIHPNSEANTPYDEIQTAYQETILAVDHWTEAYREATVTDSIHNEFSPAVAEVVTGDSRPAFSPQIQDQLHTEVQNAVHSRKHARDLVETEVNQLRTLREQLDALLENVSPVEHGDEPFDQKVQRLVTATQSLEEVGHRHQTYIQKRSSHADELLTGMVYAELETAHPGLAAIADVRRVLDRLELRLWAGLL